MSKGSSSAPSPDPAVGAAAMKQAELGQEWLDTAKAQFNVSHTRQVEADALTKRVVDQQLRASDTAQQWATEDRERAKSVFQPVQDQFIGRAQGWASPGRQDAAAAEARADVLNSAEAQRGRLDRSMAASGVNPASGRYEGTMRAAGTETALAAAGAGNMARNRTRKEGMALLGDAANMGSGLPATANASLGLGVNAGTAAAGATTANNIAQRSNLGILQSGYQQAGQGYAGQASTMNSLYGNQLNAWGKSQDAEAQNTAGFASAVGTLGALAFFASSKEFKEHKRPVRGILQALDAMPVEAWTYKRGLGDGKRHIGPYAEDFQRETGLGDGKTISVIDAVGVTMGAVRELSAKVTDLAANLADKRRNIAGGEIQRTENTRKSGGNSADIAANSPTAKLPAQLGAAA